MTLSRPDKNAKGMFLIGLLGLPWLWIVNVLYHYREVYGILPFQNEDQTAVNSTNHQTEGGILGGIMENSDENQDEDNIDPSLVKAELKKWVKRSTIGSAISTAAFITWVLYFQLNRDKFSYNWFVMSPEEESLTGW